MLARDAQSGVVGSTLELYRSALALRRAHNLGLSSIHWLPSPAPQVLAFTTGSLTVLANTGAAPVPLPPGQIVLSSEPLPGDLLPGDTTVWLLAE